MPAWDKSHEQYHRQPKERYTYRWHWKWECVFYVCLFSSLRMLILNQEKLYMSAYSVSSGNRAKNGETISKPRRVPLLLALNLSLSFCSRRFFSQLTVSPCLICLFVFSYRKHTVKALGSFAFMAGDWQVSCHVIYRCWLFWLSFLVENKVPCELIIGWRFNNLDRNCHSILANILSTIVLGIFLIYL